MNIDIFLHAFTSFIVIIDPIGDSLVFHGLMGGASQRQRVRMALKSLLVAIGIMTMFALYGEVMLGRLGININALRIAGGILLFWTAFNMITRQPKYVVETQEIVDISVYPMAIPLMAGPGVLTLTILLFSKATTTADAITVYSSAIVAYVITFFSLVFSRFLTTVMGRTGDDVLRRLMGVILAALAIQFIADGIRAFVNM